MNCPLPERLFESLAGKHGASAQAMAEAHLLICAACREAIDKLAAPARSVSRLAATIGPSAALVCPSREDLAAWAAGDPLHPAESAEIAAHVSSCEDCAYSAARLRLHLASEFGQSFPGIFQQAASSATGILAASRAPVIAQAVGALALVLIPAALLLPRFKLPELPRAASLDQGSVEAQPVSVAGRFQASFDFRLDSEPQPHTLDFPRQPGPQLSSDYEYAFHFSAHRAGWLLLFSVDPNGKLTQLVPGGDPSGRIPHLQSGETSRFPAGSGWKTVDPAPGPRRFYAIYLNTLDEAEALAAQARRAPSQDNDAFVRSLEEMASGNGCSSVDRPCVQAFEYEVF
jgi:hypothetical protein